MLVTNMLGKPFGPHGIICLIYTCTVDIDPTPPPVKAKATVSLGKPRLFSGEDVQMTCSVPDDPSSNWTYEWFHDGELLSATEVYSLNKAQVLQSGNYTCKGLKTIKAWPYIVPSIPSDPLKIHVDGKCF